MIHVVQLIFQKHEAKRTLKTLPLGKKVRMNLYQNEVVMTSLVLFRS